MERCEGACDTVGIPEHLHSHGRSKGLMITQEDRLFIWHRPLEGDYGYGNGGIPGYRWLNQSANSEQLNPDGQPSDVLFDTKNGGKMPGLEVACLSVSDLISLKFPNPKYQPKDKHGNPLPITDADMYTFEIGHRPEACMYPHCEIFLQKGGIEVKKLDKENVKSVIRSELSIFADKHREEMLAMLATEEPKDR